MKKKKKKKKQQHKPSQGRVKADVLWYKLLENWLFLSACAICSCNDKQLIIPSNPTITQSYKTPCCVWHSNDWGKTKVRLYPHKRLSVPCTHTQKLFEYFGENWQCYNKTTLYNYLQRSFVNALSQWEMTLHCNVVSHWLGAITKPSFYLPWLKVVRHLLFPNYISFCCTNNSSISSQEMLEKQWAQTKASHVTIDQKWLGIKLMCLIVADAIHFLSRFVVGMRKL